MITLPEQRKPLSEWIRSFFETLSGREQLLDNLVLSADDYLIPALRIASSLADQICKAEEAGRSPTPSSDWINSIVVHLQSNTCEDGRFDGKVAGEYDKDDEGGNSIRVEILPSLFLNSSESNISRQAATNGILHSLGLVFYEIFSRGERPAELIIEQQQQQVGKLSEVFDPFDQGGGTIDQGGELSTSDNLLGDCKLSEEDDYVSYNDLTFQGQGPRKKRTQNGNRNLSSVSVEPLKAKGLPRALCDMVSNMLDCAGGTISRDETYQNMVEVRDDLQLIMDKPSIYLLDQDMRSLSMTGLQFGDTVFGRNAELSTVIGAYRRSVSGESECELVTISGQSGTGKSVLACEFGKYVVSSGGILLFGKFDQLQQGKPFSALAAAFDQYCGMLVQNCGLSSAKQKLAHRVNDALGREVYHLVKLIPNLANILGPDMMNRINHYEDCTNPKKRLQYLLCRFVEVIFITFAAPVTLFLDDLQWADPSSIAAVNQLLLVGGGGLKSRNTRFFFIGCNRVGEDNCNPFGKPYAIVSFSMAN
jgi:hypothetical protein